MSSINNGSKKKILFILPHLMNGGAERVASNLMMNLPDDKFDKSLILYDGSRIDFPFSGKLFDLSLKSSSNVIVKLKNLILRFVKIRELKKINNFDYSISFLNNPNFINIMTKQNEKVIITIHSFKSKRISGFYGSVYELIIKILFNKADSIVAVSKDVKTDLVNYFKIKANKIEVIYNFIDIEMIQGALNEEVEDQFQNLFNKRVIINVGRPVRAKGQWHLIRAFSHVLKKNPDLNLVIIGEGDLSGYLQKLAIDLNIENNVHLLGFIKNPFKFISRSDLFVLSSIYEGFGLVLLEAMVCGIPIISTNCRSGPSEIFEYDTNFSENNKAVMTEYGVLVPVSDGEYKTASDPLTGEEIIMAEEIIGLLENKAKINQLIENGFIRKEAFTKDKIILHWYELFDKLDKQNNE